MRASAEDIAVVTELLGRAPAARFEVAVRSPETGRPIVIRNAPLLRDGTPMPTRYWLVDPKLSAVISRIEAGGGVREAERAVDPEALLAAHAAYAAERDAEISASHVGPRPSGGVAGTRTGVKCLHAHYAAHLAGCTDPVGTWVASRIERDER